MREIPKREETRKMTYTKEESSALAKELRAHLHACPEVSGQERETKRTLQEFLRAHTTLELCPCGEGFYAAHREVDAKKGAIALRADYDALPTADGAAHLCGHDGHAAALAAAALALEGRKAERNVFFLWQPAEEIGEGARQCLEIFEKEEIERIYGVHNLPGFPFGKVYTRPGTFACASCGVTLTFTGRPTHAAYPELGISPATALGELLTALPALAAPEHYTAMTLCTVIGAEMGQKAFGKAADRAELWLTLRAERDEDLEELERRILTKADALAKENGLEFSAEKQDVFPATVNDPEIAGHVLAVCDGEVLAEPMRWSEDFGHYLGKCPGAFFGIGAGEDHPGLHTKEYEYPDALLEPSAEAFVRLIFSSR